MDQVVLHPSRATSLERQPSRGVDDTMLIDEDSVAEAMEWFRMGSRMIELSMPGDDDAGQASNSEDGEKSQVPSWHKHITLHWCLAHDVLFS